VHWIRLAQDMDQWRSLTNTLMNLWVPYKMLHSLTSQATLGPQETICPTKIVRAGAGLCVRLDSCLGISLYHRIMHITFMRILAV
jgi:hypothetical protein